MAEVPEPKRVNGFKPVEGIPLQLHRMPNVGRPPVLLLHGASAQHETFCIPRSHSLAKFLWEKGYEPWLLDWRGSRRVTDSMDPQQLEQMRDVLDLDHAAREDIPSALRRIASVRDREDRTEPHKIHVVAHCLGAAVLAQAIASGDVSPKRIGRVVLLTIGLFYEAPLDGKMKSQFNVLQRLWKAGSVSLVDPRFPGLVGEWPSDLHDIYQGIGPGLRPHPEGDEDPICSHSLCNRVSFMYGVPFRHSDLVEEIHGVSTVKFTDGEAEPRRGERLRAALAVKKEEKKAGVARRPVYAPVKSPIQDLGVGIVTRVKVESGSWRRGDAAGTLTLSGALGVFPGDNERDDDGETFKSDYGLWADDRQVGICGGKLQADEPAQLDGQFGGIPLRMYLQGAYNVRRRWAAKFRTNSSAKLQDDKDLIGPNARGRFHELPAVTLITGEYNQLWHRDSINRMHEWITAGLKPRARERFTKIIIPNYGHQDLLWGKKSLDEVFPIILDKGLDGPGTSILVDDDPP
jgi:pimeloyl-ACP methyl ester carboxylesterase